MKKNGHILALLLGLQMTTSWGQLAESICIVKITGRDRTVRYVMLSETEFGELLDRIGREETLYRKAVAQARDAWKLNPPVDKPFPLAAISVPKAAVVDEATDIAEAQRTLAEYEKRQADSDARDAERDERRLETKHTRESWNNEPGHERKNVRVDKAAIQREKEENAAKDELHELAREAYRKALRILWQPNA